ncbi:NACHT domain-containing protein [Mesorhizobium captivum]|uniref:NACHT domain-containing protein n=1 Tax=Mesorhizobium captivum TaxID=3072319 RepID=UPI002A23DE57|nr:hypothetical protein [Mesorhizobium sp. VK23E]MDX8510895.1 hypothetical protein [Mesorhizobium sp. VK23E]
MQYHFETLGDERFQQLCQALLVGIFPQTQCLPVGQADGGRDAFVRGLRGGKPKEVTIFQVKFSRDPYSKEARQVINEVIRTEHPKVKRLIEEGAKEYYLLTNVAGTSYIESGSIDKANRELSDGLGINATVWWRDDLERRIDSAQNIKWSYPEIIKGTDLLQILCEATAQGEPQRRVEALRSFMVYQYRYDDRLKFKQIDLHKGIADMFVDVPARLLISEEQKLSERWKQTVTSWLDGDRTIPSDFLEIDERYSHRESSKLGALQLLVNADFSRHFPRVVVEGAPGQGKSTITQFLCQIHRMTLLGRTEISKVKSTNKPIDVRIPFRVDLRDYATWISGFDPFSENAGVPRMADSSPVLESFLAFLVSHHTGRAFSADDLAAVAKSSQLLVVLDGFDEVADVNLRNRIVAEVSNASARVAEDALSAQFIVTSRPAAFANSPGFSREEFQYLELTSLTQPVIMEYAAKWLDGRDAEPRERREITRVLTDKLSQPHVRDLARNPMQLAILLNLISVRGASLPDQRTALYQSYIDIFLNREADKSPVVRDHRSVLLKIHRYLAWLLQTEAESHRGGGNISEARLKSVLHNFLDKEGHSTELVNSLFQGVVERVFVLVARVQGTFEFEVQPIREYFAARYLYDTAPYSPPGQTVTGTLPERFIGLAKNFYWLNVTRFFAGCYSTGELASLRYGLKQIDDDENFKNIGYVSDLTLTLLQDHVFSDQPILSGDIIDWLLKEPRLTFMLARRNSFSSEASFIVPEGRSRDLLIGFFKKFILESTQGDRLYAGSRALKFNQDDSAVFDLWLSLQKALGSADQWLWIGQLLDVFGNISAPQFNSLLEQFPEVATRVLFSGRIDLLENRPSAWEGIFRRALSNPPYLGLRFEIPSSDEGYFVFFIVRLLSVEQFSFGDRRAGGELFSTRVISERVSRGDVSEFDRNKFIRGYQKFDGGRSSQLPIAALAILESRVNVVIGNIRLWDGFFNCVVGELVEKRYIEYRAIYFVCRFELKLDEPIEKVDNLDTLSPINYGVFLRGLCENPADAIKHLEDLCQKKSDKVNIALLAMLSFLPLEALLASVTRLGEILDELDGSAWMALSAAYAEIPFPAETGRRRLSRMKRAGGEAPPSGRLMSLVLSRFDSRIGWVLFSDQLKNYRGEDEFIIERIIYTMTSKVSSKEGGWEDLISFVKFAYGRGKLPIFSFRVRHGDIGSVMPLQVAKTVCSDPTAYPLDLVEAAERVVSQSIGKQAIALAALSESGGWFHQTI